ncbi:hypothetical protein [Pseudonocardia sp. NPDC049154]
MDDRDAEVVALPSLREYPPGTPLEMRADLHGSVASACRER